MPIITTFVTARSPHRLAFKLFGQRFVGPPQLADNFRYRKIPIESLPAGRAKTTCQRTADLAGDTNVPRWVSGMKTVSMPLPAPTDNSHFRVPSAAV